MTRLIVWPVLRLYKYKHIPLDIENKGVEAYPRKFS